MKLDKLGGIEIHIAPIHPEGMSKENWLPSGGKNEQLDIIMQVYAPNLEAMKAWKGSQGRKAINIENRYTFRTYALTK